MDKEPALFIKSPDSSFCVPAREIVLVTQEGETVTVHIKDIGKITFIPCEGSAFEALMKHIFAAEVP